jgi:hypothetical protein
MRPSATVECFLAEALGAILLVFIGGGTAAVAALSNLTPHGSGAATLALVTLAQVSPPPLGHSTRELQSCALPAARLAAFRLPGENRYTDRLDQWRDSRRW